MTDLAVGQINDDLQPAVSKGGAGSAEAPPDDRPRLGSPRRTVVDVPRIAIAHEWVAQRAGSEKTFEAMAKLFPSADLYALSAEPDVLQLGGRPVRTTFLDRRRLRQRRDLILPVMPLAWRWVTDERYDLVITSSHACAKGFRPARWATHLCYCHAPLRYVWQPDLDVRRASGALSRTAGRVLRRWDRRASQWVTSFAANSTAVRDRIAEFYGRDAEVIHPPVDTTFFAPEDEPRRDFALAVSRFVPYKRLDLAIEAAHRAATALVIAGAGPDERRLRARAAQLGADVRFVIAPDDDALRTLYRRAAVLLYCAEEDFGIVPVEAQACGTPVVAYGRGGACDTVVDGLTGALVSVQDADAFAAALVRVLDTRPDRTACRRQAVRFRRERFDAELRSWVDRFLVA